MRQFAAPPTSPSPSLSRRGPSLSPLGRRGAISGELAIAQYTTPTTRFGAPDSLRERGEGGVRGCRYRRQRSSQLWIGFSKLGDSNAQS
jgi:hypothetical protein